MIKSNSVWKPENKSSRVGDTWAEEDKTGSESLQLYLLLEIMSLHCDEDLPHRHVQLIQTDAPANTHTLVLWPTQKNKTIQTPLGITGLKQIKLGPRPSLEEQTEQSAGTDGHFCGVQMVFHHFH